MSTGSSFQQVGEKCWKTFLHFESMANHIPAIDEGLEGAKLIFSCTSLLRCHGLLHLTLQHHCQRLVQSVTTLEHLQIAADMVQMVSYSFTRLAVVHAVATQMLNGL